MTSPYFTIDELAERLRTSRPTISRAIDTGSLSATREPGGVWVITLADAHRYLHRHTVAPVRPKLPDLTADLPALSSLAEVGRLNDRWTRRWLEEGARATPPRFEHIRHGRKRWMTATQIDRLNASNLALSRAA